MTVVAIVQAWNPDDPVLGFVVPWMERLAARVDRLTVLALERRTRAAPANVRVLSLGKERGRSRVGYLRAWHRAWRELLRTDPPDVVFAHMSPVFAILAAPYALPRRTPIVTWFAHRHVPVALRLAHRVSSRMLTINDESYRYRRDKVLVMGHGIDCATFAPDGSARDPDRLLSVGRVSPIKDAETWLRAVARLRADGHEVRAHWLGEPPDRDRAYAGRVQALAASLGLADTARFEGGVPHRDLPARYRHAAVHVNLSPTGALDKAPLESMACGTPTVVANEGFRPLLGAWAELLLFRHGDAADLAARIARLRALDDATRHRMGADLRRAVETHHGLERLWDRVVGVFHATVDDPGHAGTPGSRGPA